MGDPDNIVVGYDGSVEAGHAVRWAAQQAACRNRVLDVVHCSLWPLLTHDLGPVEGIADSGLQHYAEAVRDEGLAQASEAAPGLTVRPILRYGWPAEHLRQASAGSAMLVVGSRGIGGFIGLLVGSVSLELAATAACPVAVIRSDDHPGGPVVVGIDAAGSSAALREACTFAKASGTRLLVVHVLRTHFAQGKPAAASAEARNTATQILQTAADRARVLAPETAVEQVLSEDTSVPHALLTAAREAALIVVGTKGQGLIRGTVGSTAHTVLHHAKSPVLIARHSGTEMPDVAPRA